jgi:hypothetical protein
MDYTVIPATETAAQTPHPLAIAALILIVLAFALTIGPAIAWVVKDMKEHPPGSAMQPD